MIPYLLELFRTYRWQLIIVIGFMLFANLFESLGLLFFIPLLSSMKVTSAVTTNNSATQGYQNWLLQHHLNFSTGQSLFLFITAFSLTIVFNAIQTLLASKIENKSSTEIRNKLYWDLICAQWNFLQSHHKGKLTELITQETCRIGSMTRQILQFISSSIATGIYLLLSFVISWYVTLIVGLLAGLIFIFRKRQNSKAYLYGKQLQYSWQKLQENIHDLLAGIKVAKCFGTEQHHFKQFKNLNQNIQDQHEKFNRLNSSIYAIYQISSLFVLGVIFYLTVKILHQPLVNIILFFLISLRIFPKLLTLQQNYQTLKNLLPSYDTLQETQSKARHFAENTANITNTIPLQHHISLKNVGYAYDQKFVLSDLTVKIPAKSFTVVLGHSGAGKSTLADLLAGLILPQQGTIVIDDVTLDKANYAQWRKNIAFVMQETFLFNDSIMANLTLANPSVTQEEITTALRLAQAQSFIDQLPQGLQTVIGDSGVRLSGGEQQRLAFARAILAKPQLLILDEVTSFLDPQNVQLILSALLELKQHITILLITHQTELAKHADYILKLEQGRLLSQQQNKPSLANETLDFNLEYTAL